MFEALLEARGVKTGRGPKERDANSATVAELAEEAGVKARTARDRRKLAKDLGAYPETAGKVDRGYRPIMRRHQARLWGRSTPASAPARPAPGV